MAFDAHWLCTGDTLSCDTNDDGMVGHKISGMWVLSTEVPQALWEYYMHSNPSPTPHCDTMPVTAMEISDIDTFLHRISKSTHLQWRLPTSDEWLYIYYGGMFSEGYRYCGSNRHRWVAWTADNSGGTMHPIAQRIPNEARMYDMLGNAAEMATENGNIVMLGGSYRDKIHNSEFKIRKTLEETPPEIRSFRIVADKALWFEEKQP